MTLDFSEKELIFLYCRLKKELNAMKSQKIVRYPKSEFQFYTDIIDKMEKAYPSLMKLPL